MKKKTGTLLISACMMVKDEEDNLGRCLKSIKNFVDEIIVVDTGSTDRTVEIAKHFGARVFHHPWQNDFSLHRNQSISYAKGKWVFIIDADEELVLSNGASWQDVRNVLSRIDGKFPASAFLLQDIQKGLQVMQFNSTRLFRKGWVHYEGTVHNQPQVDGQAVFNPHAFIKHYGYDLSPEKKEKKFKRTETLLLKQVEDGQLADGLAYFYLCQLYATNGNNASAAEWGEKYWSLYSGGGIQEKYFNKSIYFTMVKQYMKLGIQVKAYEWLERGIEKVPGDLDLAMAALEYGVWIKNEDLIFNAARDFIALYDVYMREPDAKAKKFVFALREEILAIAQFHLTLNCLKQGTRTLQKMVATLSKLPKPFMDGMLADLNRELKASGLPVQFGKPAEVGQSQVEQEQPVAKQEFTTMSLN